MKLIVLKFFGFSLIIL